MDIELMKNSIDRLSGIVATWEKDGRISELERSLALDKLKQLYETILFAAPAEQPVPDAKEESQTVAVHTVRPRNVTPQGSAQAGEWEELKPEPKVEESVSCELADSIAASDGEDLQLSDSAARMVHEDDIEPVIEVQPVFTFNAVSEDDKPDEAAESDEATDSTAEYVPSFGAVRHKFSKQALRSIYEYENEQDESNNDSADNTVSAESCAVTVDEEEPSDIADEVSDSCDTPSVANGTIDFPSDETEQNVFAESLADSGTKTVLGDVINAGERVLGETMAAEHMDDVASRIASDKVKSIRGAIGVNDKFLLIRDLFAGSVAGYEMAVDKLERFDSIEDAMLYIHDNFNWNPNSEGAKLLVDIISRKLM